MSEQKQVMLVILDGWGEGNVTPTNAIAQAKTPNMDLFSSRYPKTTLTAHNGAVGLPVGQMGNSEVGHLNIGAGRIVYQDFTRINKSVDTGELDNNKTLIELANKTVAAQKSVHLLGLVSDGGVHSHIDHLVALIRVLKAQGLEKIYVHCFMDGRDTPPHSGKGYIEQLEKNLQQLGAGTIATITGRYYAMDRDNRWDRVAIAWNALVNGIGVSCASDPVSAISEAYSQGTTDEFIKPIIMVSGNKPLKTIEDGDSVLFFNFRADRARQLTHAFTDTIFNSFDCEPRPRLTQFVTCTQYEKDFDLPMLFPPTTLERILGEEVSRQGLRQLRIAETEKYAHVTYFFNGGREAPYANEDRVLINSPKEVATYDLKPQMSAFEVTAELKRKMSETDYALIVLNYANADMVGHSGNFAAAVQACEAVDSCLGEIVRHFTANGGIVLITADHGNADIMFDETTQGPHTAHTLNPVPFIVVADECIGKKIRVDGALKDIAPTILTLMGLDIPAEMEGMSLLIN
nr:2,3-bisphosphoglycerate-independent phosphoglycerate mutase [Desulfobulbaceae bacterium]